MVLLGSDNFIEQCVKTNRWSIGYSNP